MLKHDSGTCPGIGGAYARQQCGRAVLPGNARTDARTYARVLALGSYLSLGNARAGGVLRNPAEWTGIRRRCAPALVFGGVL